MSQNPKGQNYHTNKEIYDDLNSLRLETKEDMEKLKDQINIRNQQIDNKFDNLFHKLDEIKDKLNNLALEIELLNERETKVREDFLEFKKTFFKSLFAIAGTLSSIIGAILWKTYGGV